MTPSNILMRAKHDPNHSFCACCHDDLTPKDAIVAHAGEGMKHPLHRDCFIQWLNVQNNCPSCRQKIDMHSVNSLFTWQEKLLRITKIFTLTALSAAAIAWAAGWASHSISQQTLPLASITPALTSLGLSLNACPSNDSQVSTKQKLLYTIFPTLCVAVGAICFNDKDQWLLKTIKIVGGIASFIFFNRMHLLNEPNSTMLTPSSLLLANGITASERSLALPTGISSAVGGVIGSALNALAKKWNISTRSISQGLISGAFISWAFGIDRPEISASICALASAIFATRKLSSSHYTQRD